MSLSLPLHNSQAGHAPKLVPAASNGFTVIELMVVVAVVALITSLALPSLSDFVQRFQIDRFAASLRGTINNARQNALRTGLETVVCKRVQSQNTCNTGNPNTGFERGWIVFHDQTAGFSATAASTDRNQQFDSATETLIQANQETSANFITQSFPSRQVNSPPIVISGQGLSMANNDICIMICAATDCSARPNNRYVIVNQAGHVRVETEASFAGIATGVCQ